MRHSADPTCVLRSRLTRRPEELTLHKWGYKRSREFARRLPSYRGEVVASHPVFAPSSKAATGPRSGPVPVTAPDIEYTAEDEVALEAFIRRAVATAWHSVSRRQLGLWLFDGLHHADDDDMMADRDVCHEEARGRRRCRLEAERIWRGRPESHGYVLAGHRFAQLTGLTCRFLCRRIYLSRERRRGEFALSTSWDDEHI